MRWSERSAGRLLKEGKPIRFFAQGRSMWPWIKAGDLVRIVPIDGPLRRGDVVLIERSPGDVLLHRLMEHQEGQLRLQGDHRNQDDGWFDRSQAIGKLAPLSAKAEPSESLGFDLALVPLSSAG